MVQRCDMRERLTATPPQLMMIKAAVADHGPSLKRETTPCAGQRIAASAAGRRTGLLASPRWLGCPVCIGSVVNGAIGAIGAIGVRFQLRYPLWLMDQTASSRFIVSGNCATIRIRSTACALGLARPCSQFSSVRGLVRR